MCRSQLCICRSRSRRSGWRKVPAGITGDVPRHYAACIMHLDDAVGKIIATLEKTGQRENTLLIFTSDNGGSNAENNGQAYPADDYPTGPLPASNQPLRDQKGSVYEGGTRVPCILSWPGKLKAGKHDAPVQIIDWMPTFCALAGFNAEAGFEMGRRESLAAACRRRETATRPIYTVAPGFKSRSFRVGDLEAGAAKQEQG
jgi:arylsulfatase A-like enzyme